VIFLSRKKKKRENLYEKYRLEFNDYINSQSKQTEYEQYNRIYDEIKKCYREKINSKEIDIKIERIQLEDNLGRYIGEFPKFGANYIIALTCALLPVYLQVSGIFDPKINKVLMILVIFGFLAFGIRSIAKSVDKDKPKGVVYNISLKVLDDLEAELKEEIEKAYIEAERLEKLELNNKTHLLNDIILSSIVEVAASSMFKKDGLLRKMFRKQRD
jgi:hypothetical protein